MTKATNSRRIIFYAGGICEGGGLTLINDFLAECTSGANILFLVSNQILDALPIIKDFTYKKYKTNFISRLKIELWIKFNVIQEDVLLCFGNLPPILRSQGYVYTFIQNRYLVDPKCHNLLPVKSRINLSIQLILLRLFSCNVDSFIVQTNSMRMMLASSLRTNRPINVWPYSSISRSAGSSSLRPRGDSFIYPASGLPHKNHRALIEAMILLAKKNIFPRLVLTVDSILFPELYKLIAEKTDEFNLKINNVGLVSSEEISKLYGESSALIFPSLLESYGLPLIEASFHGLHILASELDYVRDLGFNLYCTFDPTSPLSISRAILRYLELEDQPPAIYQAKIFYSLLMENSL